jgi:signal transduction histidine kinase
MTNEALTLMLVYGGVAGALLWLTVRQWRKPTATADVPRTFFIDAKHALQTPMNDIVALNEQLLQRVQDPQARDILLHTRASAEHLRAVIHDLLTPAPTQTGAAAAGDVGAISIRTQDCRVSEVVQNAVGMLAYRAQVQGLDYQCQIDADVPTWIHTDPHRLTQVLLNLLGNALKFTPTGSVHLQVQRQNAGVLLAVQDTGIGIAEEKQGLLFQRFTQADDTVQSRFGGTGLGLYISEHIVRRLGGQMGFSSETGKGSRFWVWLPLQGDNERHQRVS